MEKKKENEIMKGRNEVVKSRDQWMIRKKLKENLK